MKDWLKDKTGTLLVRVLEQVRKTATDPSEEQVHNLRTSIRRLREALRVFSDFYVSSEIRPVRKLLKTWMHLAAEIRNRDITIELLDSSRVPAARLRRSLEEQREEYRARIVAELTEASGSSEIEEWQVALAHLRKKAKSSTWKAKDEVEANAARVLPVLRTKYWKAGKKLLGKHLDFETLHRFRLKTKNYRYTVELFRDLQIEADVDGELERLKPVQDLLGDINDCSTALELIGGTSRRHPRFAQFLHERAAKKIAKLGSVLEENN